MFTLEESAVKELELFIQEIPLKYGLPIMNILQKSLSKQEQVEPEKVEGLKTEKAK